MDSRSISENIAECNERGSFVTANGWTLQQWPNGIFFLDHDGEGTEVPREALIEAFTRLKQEYF